MCAFLDEQVAVIFQFKIEKLCDFSNKNSRFFKKSPKLMNHQNQNYHFNFKASKEFHYFSKKDLILQGICQSLFFSYFHK